MQQLQVLPMRVTKRYKLQQFLYCSSARRLVQPPAAQVMNVSLLT